MMQHLSIERPAAQSEVADHRAGAVLDSFRVGVDLGLFWAGGTTPPQCRLASAVDHRGTQHIELTLEACSSEAPAAIERALRFVDRGASHVVADARNAAAAPRSARFPGDVRHLPFEVSYRDDGDLMQPVMRVQFVRAVDAGLEARILAGFDAWRTLADDGAFPRGRFGSPPPFIGAVERYLLSPTIFQVLLYSFFVDHGSFDALLSFFGWLHVDGHGIAGVEIE